MRRKKSNLSSSAAEEIAQKITNDGINHIVAIADGLNQIIGKDISFQTIAEKNELGSYLKYCCVVIQRFCEYKIPNIEKYIEICSKDKKCSFSYEIFALCIIIMHETDVFPSFKEACNSFFNGFNEHLDISREVCGNLKELGVIPEKIRGNRIVDEFFVEKHVVSIYSQSQIDYWSLILEFKLYRTISTIINESISNKIIFPEEFLLRQFAMSGEAVHEFYGFIHTNSAQFFGDQRWVSFLAICPALSMDIVTNMVPSLPTHALKPFSTGFDPLFRSFVKIIDQKAQNVINFIQFFVNCIDNNKLESILNDPSVSNVINSLLLAHFEEIFACEEWCIFVEDSPIMQRHIIQFIYPQLTLERKSLCNAVNERHLDNLLVSATTEVVVDYFISMPIDFLIQVLSSKSKAARQFRDSFLLGFDEFIAIKKWKDFLESNNSLLKIIISQIIPKAESKQVAFCKELFEVFIIRSVADFQKTNDPISTFVRALNESVPIPSLRFDKLSFSTQISVFNLVAQNITSQDLEKNRMLFTDFFKPFLGEKKLVSLLPEPTKRPFYNLIVLPFLTTNTLELSISQLFELSCSLTSDPFAEQEKNEFFTFISRFSTETIPLLEMNPQVFRACFNFMLRNEKIAFTKNNSLFSFIISLLVFINDSIFDPQVVLILVSTFDVNYYCRNIESSKKLTLLYRASEVFGKKNDMGTLDKVQYGMFIENLSRLVELMANDSSFIFHAGIVISRENKGFLSFLSELMMKGDNWSKMLQNPDVSSRFLILGLECLGNGFKATVFNNQTFESLFSFMSRNSLLLSQNDLLRYSLIGFFLSELSFTDQILSLVPQPSHRAFFFSEFSDPTRNAIISSLVTVFLERCPSAISLSAAFYVYVSSASLPYVMFDNHELIISLFAKSKSRLSQEEFNIIFHTNRRVDVENALYLMCKSIGIDRFLAFIRLFTVYKPGNENSFAEIKDNVILRCSSSSKESVPESIVQFEKENPRYRKFIPKPAQYLEFSQGMLAFFIMFYISIFSYKSMLSGLIILSTISSILTGISTFIPMYFSSLTLPGMHKYFWIQVGCILISMVSNFVIYMNCQDKLLNIFLLIANILWVIGSSLVLYKRFVGKQSLLKESDPLFVSQ